jgi:hypothetical protein
MQLSRYRHHIAGKLLTHGAAAGGALTRALSRASEAGRRGDGLQPPRLLFLDQCLYRGLGMTL